MKIRQPLVAAHADNTDLQRKLAISYDHLGDICAEQDTAQARRYYDQSREIRERMAHTLPNNPQAREDLSISYEKLGSILPVKAD